MRNIVFTGFIIGIEIMVVTHWFVYPEHLALRSVAMAAGVVMCLMALADFALMFGVFRKNSADPQQLQELLDLAKPEPVWVFATFVQIAFLAAALVAGVYWMAVALVLGQGAELTAFAIARWRVRKTAAMETP